MKLSSLLFGGLAAWIFSADSSGRLPEAVGLDVDGLIAQYLPIIMGVVLAFVNESENIPEIWKKIANTIGKSKGANTELGKKALDFYHKAVELLELVLNDPDAEPGAIEDAKDLVTMANRKLISTMDNSKKADL